MAPAALLSGPAWAVLAPEYYEEARRSAPNHIQIAVEDVDSPNGGMGACAVEGTVVKVFRGDLVPGAELAFEVACYDYGTIPSGPTLWTDYDALSEAKFLEAFMSADPEPRIALDQVEIVMAPRDTPYCDSQSLYCESLGRQRGARRGLRPRRTNLELARHRRRGMRLGKPGRRRARRRPEARGRTRWGPARPRFACQSGRRGGARWAGRRPKSRRDVMGGLSRALSDIRSVRPDGRSGHRRRHERCGGEFPSRLCVAVAGRAV